MLDQDTFPRTEQRYQLPPTMMLILAETEFMITHSCPFAQAFGCARWRVWGKQPMQICLRAVLHKTQQHVARLSCTECRLRSGFGREGSDWSLPQWARNTKNNQSFKKHHGKHWEWLQWSPLIMTSVFSLIGTTTARTHTRSSPQTSLQSSA